VARRREAFSYMAKTQPAEQLSSAVKISGPEPLPALCYQAGKREEGGGWWKKNRQCLKILVKRNCTLLFYIYELVFSLLLRERIHLYIKKAEAAA